MMQSLRKLVSKPRVDDWSPLAKFYYADEELNAVANELDSFDGRRDPERCNQLVMKLRQAQDRLLHIISEMMLVVFPKESDRVCRDYRAKFPEEIIHDNLPGQLWFGAECLTAGSNIIDHETESEAIRPMARALTKQLDSLRDILKEQSLRDPAQYSDKIKTSLKQFDCLFAEFELNYVSAMVPVKSAKEHDNQLDLAVLFSETLERSVKLNYINQEQIEDCDPMIMIALPRLSIVSGLLFFPDGVLNINGSVENLSDMFRPFYSLLAKIRDLIHILNSKELCTLELALCSGENAYTENSKQATFTIYDFKSQIGTEKIDVSEIPRLPIELDRGSYNTQCNSHVNQDKASIKQQVLSNRDDKFSLSNESMINDDNSVTSKICSRNPSDEQKLRSRFRSSNDLIHRLFVCISGVADQLQTNYPSDLRRVLKMVLQPNEVVPVYEVSGKTAEVAGNEEETGIELRETLPLPSFIGVRWVPDSDCEQCTACSAPFTLVRRRHHCRNCGRIFCSKCSSNSLPLPELGYDRRVRVCNLCFIYKINSFTPCEEAPNISQEERDTVN